MTVHEARHVQLDANGQKLAASAHARQVAALVWRRSGYGLQILLVTSRTSGRWVLPKGWAEEGENPAMAAAREAFEEAGIIGSASPEPIGSYLYAKKRRNGRLEPIRVEVFPMEAASVAADWPEKNMRRQVWVSPLAAATMVEEQDLAALIRNFPH